MGSPRAVRPRVELPARHHLTAAAVRTITETSNPRILGDVFELTYDGRSCGSQQSVGEITFYYSMYGDTTGSLSVVRLWDNVQVWRRDGQQSPNGNEWLFGNATLHGAPFAFRGVRGTSYTGDIAIDTVSVSCETSQPPSPPYVPPPCRQSHRHGRP